VDSKKRKQRPGADPTPKGRDRKEKDAHPQYISEGKARRRREFAGAATGYVEVKRDRKVFARNLDRLTKLHGLTRRQAAERVGANHLWYRRAVTKGLTRITTGTRPVLEKIIELFHLTRPEDLWDADLIRFERTKALSAEADADTNLVWRQKEWWPWAEKLAHILASGQHNYLIDLIDALYKSVPKDVLKEPAPGASYWSSDEIE
jgi:hypothetical protein